jgi:putative peptidoglycan binding protein
MPRRRRGAKASAFDDQERNFALRVLLHSPKDTAAGAMAAAIVIAIIANALFLQAGRHPAPMFGSAVAVPGAASGPNNPLPRPRPVEADASQPDSRQAETKAADPLAVTVKATNALPVVPLVPRPPTTIPVAHTDPTSRRLAAVQRALTEYGYGQLKPTGVMSSDTQAAIQKFERTRKLPVTGQVSDRLVRELTAMTGHPIE